MQLSEGTYFCGTEFFVLGVSCSSCFIKDSLVLHAGAAPVQTCHKFVVPLAPSLKLGSPDQRYCPSAHGCFFFILVFVLVASPAFLLGILFAVCCFRNNRSKSGDGKHISTDQLRALPKSTNEVTCRKQSHQREDQHRLAFMTATGDCVHLSPQCCNMKSPKRLKLCKRCFG